MEFDTSGRCWSCQGRGVNITEHYDGWKNVTVVTSRRHVTEVLIVISVDFITVNDQLSISSFLIFAASTSSGRFKGVVGGRPIRSDFLKPPFRYNRQFVVCICDKWRRGWYIIFRAPPSIFKKFGSATAPSHNVSHDQWRTQTGCHGAINSPHLPLNLTYLFWIV